MSFPEQRPRRLRSNEIIRRMVRETALSVDDFLYPVFVTHGKGIARPVEAMPGIYNYSIDRLLEELTDVTGLGIPGVLLFGIPAVKDELGSEAYARDGIVQKAVRAIKKTFPGLLVVTDICLCEYTSHGHCGVVENGSVLNDPTLELLARTAVSHAAAGADMVAPSDMMDGRVGAIRAALDAKEFENVLIMAYSAKYASAFYGPFREAAGSAPQFGDRKTYQMDPANAGEALREVRLDIEEGADIVMVKPALAYLDVIRRVKDETGFPVAAYNVSGEYSMIKAAAQKGWIDERKIVLELLTGIKRAGADIILTYHARDAARWLREGEQP
ncbi:porphobilinogen synthase [Pelotomaculum terephthalicicum JT]|uniref:porphobilinogen synthase n=1 Tax=Pelotomaculum TaxID=191373 RepID=UPI0009C74CFA|nr:MULTISPECIES: porphobilinogen synthase [Pelotomaculum]MCG9967602.1 porphobilinogen synthase [Pelotomaculum terephthalicicum JT]OPX91665.1 MAG: Delta-aminolevulinic acid dehydratase [Pelotomaculum sp. PtaB.Bin117]OPY61833.1 MAG: Delta-aminolevulinic acid dehydratase [Pelotomaculum sp. PtaU1.Bin065]